MRFRASARLSLFDQIQHTSDALPVNAEPPSHLDLRNTLRTPLRDTLKCRLCQCRAPIASALHGNEQHSAANRLYAAALTAAPPDGIGAKVAFETFYNPLAEPLAGQVDHGPARFRHRQPSTTCAGLSSASR
jgi:hypothetical protein